MQSGSLQFAYSENMDLLRQLANEVDVSSITCPSGRVVKVASWLICFPCANPDRLPLGTLERSYTIKPLVGIDGVPMFGELAIVALLRKDHWTAFWVDTFHGHKFWQGMPHVSQPVLPPPQIRGVYDRIAARKGGSAGCFDVVAWKDGRIVWLEYKGPKDKPNRNELCWVDAAIDTGVAESDLFFVGADRRAKAF